ncbi:TatD family hydrolase [Candidatus Woesearchaeota archaeon]|nr:TatD family hydrolase [Candidatus Woesearchaeota archaeon]
MLIDIHCHLDHPSFNGKTEEIINNAEQAGLKIILTAGINPETNRKTLELAGKFDIVKPALGIYPVKTLQKEIESGEYPLKKNIFDIDEEIVFIKKNKDKITAIGECGLDYSQNENSAEQKKLLEKLISLAEKINKPIIIHSRKAESDCIDLLESSKLKKVLMHCFSGKKKLVKKASDLGYYFSIPANVVRAQNFQLMVEELNINQLFCETDSPYLSPFKEQRNEPAFILESYKKIAEIKKMDLKEVINNIYMNWQNVFN